MVSKIKDFLFFMVKVVIALIVFHAICGALGGAGQMVSGFVYDPVGFFRKKTTATTSG